MDRTPHAAPPAARPAAPPAAGTAAPPGGARSAARGAPHAARPSRPVLQPALRRLWRDGETLQLGRLPGRAVVLAGIDEPVRATLALLDGSRDSEQLEADALRAGCPPQRTAELVDLLDDAGLLEDAACVPEALLALPRPDRDRLGADVAALSLLTGARPGAALARRAAARVHVAGAGRVGTLVAATLGAAGVGTVDVVDEGTARPADVGVGGLLPEDVGRSRGEAARERLRAAAPSVRCEPVPAPDLVVLAPVQCVEDDVVADLLRRGVPHLLAEVRGSVGVVGPLVLPGRSSCLQCLDLTRTDLDPGWPWIAAQLSRPSPGVAACDVALAASVAAQASMQVLAALDETARPAALDGTLEQVLPDYRWRRRSWTPHPACACAVGVAG